MKIKSIVLFVVMLLACTPSISHQQSNESPKARSQKAMERVIWKETQRMKAVYENALSRNPNVFGGIRVRFVIQPDGNLKDVGIDSCNINDHQFVKEILEHVSTWKFPPTNDTAGIHVVYPFVFEKASK
jgi:hypothetical protein